MNHLTLDSAPSFEVHERPDSLFVQVSRKRLVFVSVFAITSAVLLGAMFVWPKSYRAIGEVVVAQDPLPAESAQGSVDKIGDPADIESQVILSRSPRLQEQILKEPAVRDALMRECDAVSAQWFRIAEAKLFPDSPTCKTTLAKADTAPEAALIWMGSRFSVQPEGQSRVISISYSSPLPDVAMTLTNSLIDAYLEDSVDAKRAPRAAAVEWLHKEIARLADEMNGYEVQIQQYRESHGLLPGQYAPIIMERLTELTRQLAAAEGVSVEADARLQELIWAQASGQGLEASSAVIGSHTVQVLKEEIAKASAANARLGYNSAIDGPSRRQLDDLRARLSQEMAWIADSARRDQATAAARVHALRQEFKELGHDVGNALGAEAMIAGMMRKLELDRELFISLSKRANELETERRLLSGNAQLVSYAMMPPKPWFPKYLPFSAVSLVLAAAAATLASVVRDKSDKTVRSDVSLELATGVRGLACLPKVNGLLGHRLLGHRPIDKDGSTNPAFQESIRTLYAELMLTADARPRSLVVTSAELQEGKTVVSLALAKFAAAAGLRVLVIEGDLRQPSFPDFGIGKGAPGVSEFLRGSVTIGAVTYPTGTAGLSFIPAGRPSMDSTELLGNGRLEEALKSLESAYDLIIVDSPPTRLLLDARLIARQVDGVVFCARWGKSQSASVLAGIRDMKADCRRILGIVINMVNRNEYPSYGNSPLRAGSYLALRRG